MSPRTPARKTKHLRASDARVVAKLATQAVHGITRATEGVHQSVWARLGVHNDSQPERTQGLTAWVYRAIHGLTFAVGRGLDSVLARLQPHLERVEGSATDSPERQAVVAALNGVMGDHLAATHNPMATRMQLRLQGVPLWDDPQALALNTEQAQPQVLLLIHGLCMNDLQWTAAHEGQAVNHGETLAHAMGCTLLTLRYNSGLHISSNGQELAVLLETLQTRWPVPLQEIHVLAHSMGGLVMRSSVFAATQAGMRWPQQLKTIVFLGTPHHGAPLERAGNRVDVILASTPTTAPLGRLAQLRSSGITDLRYGLLLDEDWLGRDRFRRSPDRRTVLPLPDGVACYAVAATVAGKRGLLAERLLGDGLVPLQSALGQHDDPKRCLHFAKTSTFIAYHTSHLALLGNPEVAAQLLRWLKPNAGQPQAVIPAKAHCCPGKLSHENNPG
jgi:pimeloyl-ACP methyl ester carboxylesterase